MKKETQINHCTATDGYTVLPAGFIVKSGDFSILFDEETGELKITTHSSRKHIKIRPKADNSIVISACR